MSESGSSLFLDVDTGIDDALALVYATASSRLHLVGVSAVVGNVPVDLGARNTAAVLAAVGQASIPSRPVHQSRLTGEVLAPVRATTVPTAWGASTWHSPATRASP